MDCYSKRSIDYYGLLGIKKDSTDLEIKQAYRRLALQYNPGRQNDEKLNSLFSLVGEAYEVLSSPLYRAIYDQYGEEGLKKWVLTPQGWQKPYSYHEDPIRTFREFFGTDNPYADLLDVLRNPVKLFEITKGKGVKQKEPTIYNPLELSLEVIYTGGMKKVKIQRKDFANEDKTATEIREHILSIRIKRGIPVGTEIKFPEAGDRGSTIIPGDIIFVVVDKPHKIFKRNGNDLCMTHSITLEQSLTGVIVPIQTLDKRKFNVNITDIVKPNYTKVIDGEGMPIIGEKTKKGNLIITFNITFPNYLPDLSKRFIIKALHNLKENRDSSEIIEDEDKIL